MYGIQGRPYRTKSSSSSSASSLPGSASSPANGKWDLISTGGSRSLEPQFGHSTHTQQAPFWAQHRPTCANQRATWSTQHTYTENRHSIQYTGTQAQHTVHRHTGTAHRHSIQTQHTAHRHTGTAHRHSIQTQHSTQHTGTHAQHTYTAHRYSTPPIRPRCQAGTYDLAKLFVLWGTASAVKALPWWKQEGSTKHAWGVPSKRAVPTMHG